MQKSSKTIFLITIVLVSLLCLTAVSAAGDDATIIGDYSSADDIAVTASEDAQTVENTDDDASYDSLAAIANDTGDLDQSTNAASSSDVLAEGESNSFTNLANNINNAGGYLSLSGNYAYDSTLDTDYANGITISKDITINGGGSTTISGNDLARIFNIENGYSVVLLDITFTNGKADNGGAIYNDGTLVLKDCKFTDNSADYGAAIYNTENGELSGDADFIDNAATYRGGGIYSEGFVDLSDSTFDGNDITFRTKNDDNGGAAIYNNGGTCNLDNVKVTNNLKDIVIRNGNAGDLVNAVIFSNSRLYIVDSYIANNSGSWGAGVYVTGDETFTVSGTTFENNMATFGAGIYAEGATIIVENCIFNENHCEGVGSAGTSNTQAGAILIMNGGANSIISGSTFTANSANTGGAVSISQANGDITIKDCQFNENTASYEGGAIYNYIADGAELTVKDSTFTDNTAANWGDAISNDAGLKLEGNTISGDANTAIGNWLGTIDTQVIVTILDGQAHTITSPVYELTATVTDDNNNPLMDHNFVFTIGDDEVPASYYASEGVYKATYTFKNPGTFTVSTNSYEDADVTTSEVTFESPLKALQDLIDLAIANGESSLELSYGFAYIESYDADIAQTGIIIPSDFSINGNGVTIDGGDASRIFTVNAGTLTLNNVTLANGKADDGAGVYVESGAKLDATATTFKDNVATYSGGAIYTEGGQIVLVDSLIDNNDVEDATQNNGTGGAAIYAKNAEVALVNTNVTNNGRRELDRSQGDLVDGVITLKNTDATITGGLFENNTGIYGGAIYANGENDNSLTVTGATFNNNKAYNGAAIDIESVETSISGSTFTDNFVVGPGSTGYYGAGGAIAAAGSGSFALSDSTFTGNKAEGTGATGGAIHIGLDQDATATISADFTDNSATNKGGAIFYNGYNMDVDDSTFTDNTAAIGGAIYVGGLDTSVTDSVFSGNDADEGKSIYNAVELSLSGNTLDGDGMQISSVGQIDSQVIVSVNYNEPESVDVEYYDAYHVYIKITDDMGNAIQTNLTELGVRIGSAMFSEFKVYYNEETGLYEGDTRIASYSGLLTPLRTTLIKYFPTYNQNTDLKSITVNRIKVDSSLEVTYDNVSYPEDVVINIHLIPKEGAPDITAAATGIYKFIVTVNDVQYPVQITNGTGTLTISDLPAGDYVINASWVGNANYNGIEQLYDLTVYEKQGTFKDLQQRIESSEGTLYLPYDFAYDPEYDGADLANGIVIDEITIIKGNGFTISGEDSARIFYVSSSILNLENLTICNGAAEKGAGVYVDAGSILTADGVTFTDNVAVKRGGAIYSEGIVAIYNSTIDSNDITFRTKNDDNGGAAIYNLNGRLYIENTNITNNLKDIVIRNGNAGDLLVGVVVTSGETTIKDSYFANNTGSWGGAISSLGYLNDEAYTLTVTGTTFEGNNATFGGAIFVESSNLVVDDCTFTENSGVGVGSAGTSNTQGGAIVVFPDGAKATITDSTFTANSADTGGAVSLAGVDQDSLIEGCTFTDNTADDGGAIYLWTQDDAAVTVKDSVFSGNTAGWGNAISTDGALKLEGNTISTTSADIGNWEGSIESKVIAVILSNDTYNWHMDGFLINATLTDDNGNLINDRLFNFVISKEGSDDVVVPARFYTNLGYYQGFFTPADAGDYLIGIDYPESEVQTSIVKISRTLTDLANIIANDEDGVIELDGDYSYVDEFDAALVDGIVIDDITIIKGNGFTICGEDSARIFYVSSSVLDLQNITICHGAAEKGAGVYVDAGSILTADGVTFTENVAEKRGGAIYSEGIVAIYNSTIDSNDITFRTKNDDNGGAAIYNLNGQLYIENTNITNNLKDIVIRNGNAGDLLVGVVVTSGETTIKDSYFANNTGSWGGAISSLGYMNDEAYTLTVTGTTFEGNNATFGGAIFVESSNLVVDDCTFTENSGVGVGSAGTSNTQGGAIVVFPNGAKATITDSTFTANSANTGGAVSLAGVDQDSLIEGCTFTDNTAEDGGAIYLWTQDDAAVTVKDSVFSGNTAGWGNAISTDGALKLEGNTISTTSADIGNYFGSIESKVIVQILGNDTTEGAGIVEAAFGETVPIYAVITDDNGNLIMDKSLVFTISSNAGTKSVDASYNAETNKYEAEYDIESAGKHLVSITSSADEFLVINTGIIDVPKADVTLTLDVEDIHEGQKAVVTGQIIGINDTGIAADIIVVVNDVEYNITTTVEENGTFSFEIPDLTAGSYGAFAIFLGDDNYNYEYASDLFEVKERQLAVVITNLDDLQNFVYGDQVTLDFTVTDAITGEAVNGAEILITNYDDADISYYDEEGNYQVNLGMLKPGDYELSALFKVAGYESLTYEPVNVKVSKADIDVIVNRINDTITYGQDETIFVGTNNTAFEGTISITLINYYNGTVIASFDVTLDPEDDVVQELGGLLVDLSDLNAGKYNITAKFEGNDGYNADEVTIQEPYNTFEVKKAGTILIIEVPSVSAGGDIPVSVLLYDEFNNPISGDVYLEVPGIETPLVVEVVDGVGDLNVTSTLATNTDYEVTAEFRSTTNYEASDDSDKFDVIGLHTEIIIEPVEDISYGTETEGTFTIVDVEGNPVTDFNEAMITVTVDDAPVDVIIKDGVGTYTIPANLAVGPHTVAVVFAGDNKYAGSDATATVVVKQASTLVTITAPSEITYGDALTVETALTSGGQAIEGNVEVVVKDAQGNVVSDLSKLPVGTYTIAAAFAGNDNYLGDDDTATVVVKQASSSVVVIPIAEINVGETQSITVTVGPEGAEGTVKVIVTGDGYSFSKEYEVYELEDPITLEDLSEGDYSIDVIFDAGANYGLSTASADFTVKSTDVAAKVNATFINFGENVTVTIEGMPEDVPVTDLNITDNGKEIAVTLNGNEFVYAPAESGDHVIAINYNGTAYDKFYAETSFTVAPEGEYTVIPANNSAEAVQEAINNAPAGATIKLADNTTYDLAGIELNNNVTIAGGEGTVITVPAGQSSAFVAAANASDVNIKNVKFVATSDNQSLLSVTPNDLGGGISQVPAITIENVTAIPAAGVNESTISLLNVNTSSNPFKPSSDVSISKNIMASGVSSLKTNASALSGNVALKKAVKTTLTGANTQKVYAIPYKAAKSGKYYSVTLKDANGNVLAGKNVKFTLAGKTYTVKTDAKGVAKLAINIYKPGTYKLAVSFAGEATLGASSKQATIKILKNKVKITRKTKKVKRSNKKRTLKYYVKTKTGKKMGIKGVKVYLKINKKTYKAKTNKKGLVKFKVKLPRVKKTYKVKVIFKGNKANKKKTLKTKVKVY